MILSVSLNPKIEKIGRVKRFVVGKMNKIEITKESSGGRGINAARFIKKIGGEVVITGIIGGKTGEYIEEELRREGLDTDFYVTEEESRISIKIFDERGLRTDVSEAGPLLSPIDTKGFVDKFKEIVKNFNVVLLSGSIPSGVPENIYFRLITIAKDAGKITILDTEGEPLIEGIKGSPTIARVDKPDFDKICGSSLISPARRIKTIKEPKPDIIIVNFEKGNILFNFEEKVYHLLSPEKFNGNDRDGFRDRFIGAISFFLDNGSDYIDSIKKALSISLKEGFNFERKLVLKEV